MKKYLGVFLFLFCAVGILSAAEVSERRDIGVFPMYSSYNLPQSAYQYFDDRLMGMLSKMPRFKVVGYQYRLDNNSAEQFIQKIRDLKKQSILNNTNYMDADLGVVVIPAAEMEKLVNSFFIFVPSINGYSSEEYNIEIREKKGLGFFVRVQREYRVTANVSVKIITANGDLLDTYNASRMETSQLSASDAYQKAINNGISGLEFFLRNLPEFKLKTRVLKVEGGTVYLELGSNLGITPGYEFVVQENKTFLDKYNEKVTTGLVRIRNNGEQWSEAGIIFGSPKVDDQLLEAPMLGGRFNIFVGARPMEITSSDIKIIYTNTNISFTNSESFSKSTYAFTLGLHLEYELGYAWLLGFNAGLMINNPLAFYFEIGPGYELYFGSMSLVAGADLSYIGSYKHLGAINNSKAVTIKGVDFDGGGIDVSMVGTALGIKPNLSFNYQFNQHFKIRLLGGYGLYFLNFNNVNFSQGSGDSAKSASANFGDSGMDLLINGEKASALPINYNGLFGGIEFVFRF